MPAYRWTCHACGDSNPRDAHACTACECPAEATSASIAAHRSAFLAAGGALKGAVAEPVDMDLTAFDILVRPVLFLLFGWWPRTTDIRSEGR